MLRFIGFHAHRTRLAPLLLAVTAGVALADAESVWPPMHSSPESLRAPTNLYDNARPFRWARQRRTDSLRVAIVVHRRDGGAEPADRWDSTVVWVMRGDAFGPVNPFLSGRRDPFVVKRVLPGGRLALRCQIPLIDARDAGDPLDAKRVTSLVLGPEPVRLEVPTPVAGNEIVLHTVPGHGRRHAPEPPGARDIDDPQVKRPSYGRSTIFSSERKAPARIR